MNETYGERYGSDQDFDCDTFAATRCFSPGGDRGSILVKHPLDFAGIYSWHRARRLDYRQALTRFSAVYLQFQGRKP